MTAKFVQNSSRKPPRVRYCLDCSSGYHHCRFPWWCKCELQDCKNPQKERPVTIIENIIHKRFSVDVPKEIITLDKELEQGDL